MSFDRLNSVGVAPSDPTIVLLDGEHVVCSAVLLDLGDEAGALRVPVPRPCGR